MAEASQVEDLQPGDHACLTFTDSDERLDLVAAFVRDGLLAGARVLCLTDTIGEAALRAELAERDLPVREAIQRGQLTVAPAIDTFVSGGSFSAARMIRTLGAEIKGAATAGHQGLRITSDMCWTLRPVGGLDQLMTYESQFAELLAEGRAIAICQYDRQCFDTITLSGVAANHALAVAAVTYHDDALLRICRQYLPAGLRVAGELDYRAIDALTRALSEALALDEHVHVNLTHLRFVDVAAAGAFIQAGLSMSDGQRMTVRCQPQVYKVLQALGADELPHLGLVVTDDDN
jgi:anti-anti-sigma regulatory factor